MSGTGTFPDAAGVGDDAPLRVLGIAGSLRERSFNRALLRAARDLAPEEMEITIYEGLAEIPPYNADVDAEGDPEPVAGLKDMIRRADGLLLVTPEYNYGVPGVLKNAFDWASRPGNASVLIGKPTALMGASPGLGGSARAQLALRQSLVFTQSPTLPGPEVLVAKAAERFDDDLRLVHEPTREFVRGFLLRFDAWIRRFVQPGATAAAAAPRPRPMPGGTSGRGTAVRAVPRARRRRADRS